MNIENIETIPALVTRHSSKERQAKYRLSEAVREYEHDYKQTHKRQTNDAAKARRAARYDSRIVVAWDGEGINRESDGKHVYNLFACMASCDRKYRSITDNNGLTFQQCITFIMKVGALYPNALHVIFGGNYDVNMILRTAPFAPVEKLYRDHKASFGQYRIAWLPGKHFRITRLRHKRDGHTIPSQTVTIYDTVSFFQCSFVNACDEYLGHDWTLRDQIIADKQRRGTFTETDLDGVQTYNEAELTNLIDLITELRQRLARVDIRPQEFNGPGSIASTVYKSRHIKECEAITPKPVAQAARFAYSGGRFEPVRFGWFHNAHEYDINSAYPNGLVNVPNLARGHWEHHIRPSLDTIANFGLYHLRTNSTDPDLPNPMVYRDPSGNIAYPKICTNWVWSPEALTIAKGARMGLWNVDCDESWEYVPNDPNDKPLAWIRDMYYERQALKAAGDGAQKALKLAINSCYGKLAQQIGAEQRPDGTWKLPAFHQLEWAGYTTSHCRALVLDASLPIMNHIIAYETDALFTDCECPHLPVSNKLGEFEHTQFPELIYMQSGVYGWRDLDGTEHVKSRGVDRGYLTLPMIEESLSTHKPLPAPLTRFTQIGTALQQGIDKWCTWETVTKHLSPAPTGKRIHDMLCPQCITRDPHGPHTTIVPYFGERASCEYPVEWINPNPNMDVHTLRDECPEFDLFAD